MANNPQPITNNPAPSRYLVTGAAGFIGARVAEMLLADGHTVVGIDNLNDYYDVRLKDYRLSKLLGKSYELGGSDPKKSIFTHNKEPLTHNRFEFRVLDIENIKELDELFRTRKFEAVFSLAARAGVRYSMEHPEVYLSTNVLGTLNLLECQRKHGVKKQVLASTSSLYDGCPMPFTEDQPVNTPLSPYAATKKAAELMAYSYHKLYGLDISVARYFTVFGPAGRPDMSIFRFIKWIDEGKPLELFGDGTQSRDFTYIDDIARGTILAVKPFGYQIINLGGGRQPLSLTTVIAFIEKALAAAQSAKGKAARETLGSSPLPLSSSPVCAKIHRAAPHIADIKETWADIAKAKRLLGWKPQVTPEDGFRLTVDWHVANRSWLKGIKL